MNKTVIIVLVVLGALLLGVPVLNQLKKEAVGGETAAPVKIEPYWNELNLPGTAWIVPVSEMMSVTVHVLPGGEAVASDPMLKLIIGQETLPGTWRVAGDKLYVATALGERRIETTLDIVGEKLIHKDPDTGEAVEIKRTE